MPGETPELLAFGDLGVDSVARVDRLPRPDEKIWVEPGGDFAGGMIGNFAATAAALGVRTGVVALLGDDWRGDLVLDDMSAFGIDTSRVRRLPHPTFWTLSLTTSGGERSLLQFPTEAFAADWENFDASDLEGVTWVHTTAEQGAPVGSLFESAHRAGVAISIDVEDPFVLREDMADLARLADVVFLNSAAAGSLGGPDRAARTMREWGAPQVLVTLGALGCLLLSDGELREIPAISVESIDANGAGDCFAAAFVAARIRGWDPLPAAEFANLVGAVSTTAYGGHGADFSRDTLARAARDASMPWWDRLP